MAMTCACVTAIGCPSRLDDQGKMSWGVLAYPLDPGRPSIPQVEQLSPWSLDGGRKVVFTSLPHVASDAVTKLRALMAAAAAELDVFTLRSCPRRGEALVECP